MQYPQIQFYRGSLVRLVSGQLKQVEDLNSDDFLESARSLSLKQQQQLLLQQQQQQHPQQQQHMSQNGTDQDDDDSIYIDSSVVRDFLEVGPIPGSSSPTSSTGSDPGSGLHPGASASTSTSSPSSSRSPTFLPPTLAHISHDSTVLIKFFLESTRTMAFIEVPVEHPFFVLHRGWSSWNPQRTYDKFGLKCRKLKIGDTCISLIRRRQSQQQIQCESDHCNFLFSSIKIDE